MKQKLFAGMAVLSVSTLLAACGSGSGTESSGDGLPDVIKIGVIADESGAAGIADVGQPEVRGIQVAVDQLNASGVLGNSKIELVTTDTQADTQQSISATRRLIDQEKVSGIVGYTLTPSFFAAAPIIQQSGMPVVTGGLTGPDVTKSGGSTTFRIIPVNTQLLESALPAAWKAYGTKTFGVLYQTDTPTTVLQADEIEKLAKENGVTLVSKQGSVATDTDLRAQLTQIKGAEPDAWTAVLNAGQISSAINQAGEIGLLPATRFTGDPQFDVIKGTSAVNDVQCTIFSSYWDSSSTEPASKQFVADYTDKYDSAPTEWAGVAHDAMLAMGNAIAAAKSVDHEKVVAALQQVKVDGVLGSDYGFSDVGGEERSGDYPLATHQVQGDTVVDWTPQTTCDGKS